MKSRNQAAFLHLPVNAYSGRVMEDFHPRIVSFEAIPEFTLTRNGNMMTVRVKVDAGHEDTVFVVRDATLVVTCRKDKFRIPIEEWALLSPHLGNQTCLVQLRPVGETLQLALLWKKMKRPKGRGRLVPEIDEIGATPIAIISPKKKGGYQIQKA